MGKVFYPNYFNAFKFVSLVTTKRNALANAEARGQKFVTQFEAASSMQYSFVFICKASTHFVKRNSS